MYVYIYFDIYVYTYMHVLPTESIFKGKLYGVYVYMYLPVLVLSRAHAQ